MSRLDGILFLTELLQEAIQLDHSLARRGQYPHDGGVFAPAKEGVPFTPEADIPAPVDTNLKIGRLRHAFAITWEATDDGTGRYVVRCRDCKLAATVSDALHSMTDFQAYLERPCTGL
jgi:hypothetical protein